MFPYVYLKDYNSLKYITTFITLLWYIFIIEHTREGTPQMEAAGLGLDP